MLKVQISFAPKGRKFREGFGDGLSTSQGRGCFSGRKPPLLRVGTSGRVVELTVLRRSDVRTRTSTTPVWTGWVRVRGVDAPAVGNRRYYGVIVFHFFGEFVLIYDCVLQKRL